MFVSRCPNSSDGFLDFFIRGTSSEHLANVEALRRKKAFVEFAVNG
jgi:hypothetical protein